MATSWQKRPEKYTYWNIFNDVAIFWTCDFTTFTFQRAELIDAPNIRARGLLSWLAAGGCLYRYDDCLVLQRMCLVLSCTPRWCVAKDHRPTKKTDPGKSERRKTFYHFYDFMNLWIYDFGLRGGNFTHSEQYIYIYIYIYKSRPNIKKDCVGFANVTSCCVCWFVDTRRLCVAKANRLTDEKTDPWKLERRKRVMILWIYEFMTFAFGGVIFSTQTIIYARCGQMPRNAWLCITLPSLIARILTLTRADDVSRKTTDWPAQRPTRESWNGENVLWFYEFMNLRLWLAMG